MRIRHRRAALGLHAAAALGLLLCPVGSAWAGFDHGPLDAILQERVAGGRVDYAGLKENRAPLDRYVASLGRLRPEEYEGWSEPERIAFWINAYNAITLKIILDHHPITRKSFPVGLPFPVNSIRQIPGQWDRITHPVMGEPMTLNQIEHEILRQRFREPRIHMALVCAARGCPPLRTEAYAAARLDEQLDDQTRTYLANPEAGLKVDRRKKEVALSSIFNWFGKDFVDRYSPARGFGEHSDSRRAVLAFVSRYVPEEERAFLERGDYRLTFLDYDWELNERD